MKRTIRACFSLVVISILLTSCGTPTSLLTINNLSVILVVDTFLNSEITRAIPTQTIPKDPDYCSLTPDGLGQSFGSKESSDTILDHPHGRYVYGEVLNQIESSSNELLFRFSEPNMNSDPASDVGYGGATSLISESSLVSQEKSFIKRLDLYVAEGNSPDGLLVVAVDTNHLDFASILRNIPAAITFFSTDNNLQIGNYRLHHANSIVVNMSFIFIPCRAAIESLLKNNIVDVLRKKGLDVINLKINTDTPIASLAQKYESSIPNTTQEAINTLITGSDPLITSRLKKFYPDSLVNQVIFNTFVFDLIYDSSFSQLAYEQWFKELDNRLASLPQKQGNTNIIYVGAAGNFKYSYPFFPALWSPVISVSASGSTRATDCRKSIANYSNCGEAQLDGTYYKNKDINGTSFAAPKVSARIALNLLINPATVIGNSCPMSLNTPVPSAEPWSNVAYNCMP